MLARVNINPLPPIQNDVAPPSFILGIKEEPTNRNVGEIPVIDASSTPHHSQSFSSSTLHSQVLFIYARYILP